jgi:hypothetical protein
MNYKAILLALGASLAGASAANAQMFVPSAVANGQAAVSTSNQAPAANTVADAPTAPAAQVAPAAPQYVAPQYAAAQPYGATVATPSTPAPQVVYVTQAPAATYYYDSYPAYYPYGYYGYGYGYGYPVGVSVGFGWGWGGGYYGRGGYSGGRGWGGGFHGRR